MLVKYKLLLEKFMDLQQVPLKTMLVKYKFLGLALKYNCGYYFKNNAC